MGWSDATHGTDGSTTVYSIFMQEKDMSCGPASVLTLLKLLGKKADIPETLVRVWFSKIEEKAKKEEQKDDPLAAMLKAWGTDGAKPLPGTLKDKTITAADHKRVMEFQQGSTIDVLREVLKSRAVETTKKLFNEVAPETVALPGRPSILQVVWPGGGGSVIAGQAHFTVCVGKKNGELVFLDPYFGLVARPADSFPRYQPREEAMGVIMQVLQT